MKIYNNIKSFSDRFESKVTRFLVLYGTIISLFAVLPTIGGVVWKGYETYSVIANSVQLVKDVKEINEYQNFMIQQLSSVVHEETDTKIVYKIELESSNGGDLWYFDTITIYHQLRPIIYSANIKKKGGRVYVQEMDGSHKWLKPKQFIRNLH